MSSEPYSLTNPKGNNRDLAVFTILPSGERKQIALLRPGESVRPDKKTVVIEERQRPVRLLMAPDGSLSADPSAGGPRGKPRWNKQTEPKSP